MVSVVSANGTDEMLQFDAAKIFTHMGGPAALRRALVEDNQGVAPADPTVAMWRHRSRISGGWIAACVYAVMSRHPDLELAEILIRVPDGEGNDADNTNDLFDPF